MQHLISRYLVCTLVLLALALFITSSVNAQLERDAGYPLSQSSEPPKSNHPTDERMRFLRSDGDPLRKSDVWVHCFADPSAKIGLSHQWQHTDANGFATLPFPAKCPFITALHARYSQPSGKPDHGAAFTIYAASWRTGSGTPVYVDEGCAVACPSTGEVTIRNEWPLILFNVVASLEWQPEPGSPIVEQIYRGLRSGSAYLADLTDGYMAFGEVTIHTGGANWEGADLRFQTANDLRPAAFVGGIVSQTVAYKTRHDQQVTFRPAATIYGRGWDGNNAYQGNWDELNGYRTIIHEWAHYALFLYDEYQGKGVSLYCIDGSLPNLNDPGAASAMAYHYTASEFWHPKHTIVPHTLCSDTDQARVHGQSDWETLEQWYAIQGLRLDDIASLLRPTTLPDPAPMNPITDDLNKWGPLDDLFGRSASERSRIYLPLVSGGAGDSLPVDSPFTSKIEVYTSDSPTITPSQFAQVYLFHPTVANPQQIIYEGQPITGSGASDYVGSIDVIGAHSGDDLRIYVDRYTMTDSTETDSTEVIMEGGRFIHAASESATISDGKRVAQPNHWGSTLKLQFGMSSATAEAGVKLDKVKVFLSGVRNAELVEPIAQLCSPDATIGCPLAWRKAMTGMIPFSTLRYAEFEPLSGTDKFPLYFVVHVSDEHSEFDGITRWVRDLGSVDPGHKVGGAPTISDHREGPATVDYTTPRRITNDVCNRAMAMPAAESLALSNPLPAGYQLVGLPLDIAILSGDPDANGYCAETLASRLRSAASDPLRLTLFFNQNDIERLGVDIDKLTIIHFPPFGEQSSWSVFLTQGLVNQELNWVEQTIQSSGIYAIAVKP